MCEANAYILRQGNEELLLESVDEVVIQGDEIRLINIFGEQRIVKGRFLRYSGPKRALIIESLK